MNLYDCTQIYKLIDKYYSQGGESYQINEGSLGLGDMILFGENLKTCIINEVFINEWTSLHKIRFYNKTPTKFLKYIN